jgi:hypothetical protein
MVLPAIWAILFAIPAITVVTVLYPKVPLYQFRVRNLPWFRWRGGELTAKLSADVHMHNDNYMKTDIHALAFDLYFPNWNGQMHHIGHVRDRAHYKASEEWKAFNTSIVTPEVPLWTMNARQSFVTQDEVHLRIPPRQMLKSMGHLIWQIIKGGGSLTVPSTGVIHVKASSSAKVTISIMCNNTLNVFTMAMEGNECVMNKLATGWNHIDTEIHRLRRLQLQPVETSILKKKEMTPMLQKALRHDQLDALFLV